jgi:N-methylhydantoinase A
LPLDPQRVAHNFARLEADVSGSIARQGLNFVNVELHREIDMRYGIQAGEVSAPVSQGAIDTRSLEAASDEFERRYAQLYGEGSGFREAGIHALTFRVRGEGALPVQPVLPEIEPARGSDPSSALLEHRAVCLDFRKGFVKTRVYDYRRLRAGHRIEGPAIIQVPTTTVVLPEGVSGHIDQLGNLRVPNP